MGFWANAVRLLTRARRPGPDEIMPPDPWDGWPADWATSWDQGGLGFSENVSTLFACVDRISSAINSMPITAETDRQPMTRPPRWIEEPPAPIYTHTGEAIDAILTSLLVDNGGGNAYLYVLSRDATGYPAYWMVLPPDQVQIDEDQLTYRIGGNLELGVKPRELRLTGDTRVDDLLHIRYQRRARTPYGIGPLDSVRRQVMNLIQYEYMSGNIAGGKGIPIGILSSDQVVNETQAAAYKKEWMDKIGRGEIAVLGNGFKFQGVSLNAKDMALLDLRQVDGRMIAVAYGVPPFMVGLAEAGDLTYSTVQGQMDFFFRVTLRPTSSDIARSLSRWLPRGSSVRFDADAYTRPPIQEYLPALGGAVRDGLLSVDEAREAIDYPPAAGGAGRLLALPSYPREDVA